MPTSQHTVTTVCSLCEECLQECKCPPAAAAASPPTNDDHPFMEPLHPSPPSQGDPNPYKIRKQKRKPSTPESRAKDAARKRTARACESEKKKTERQSKNSKQMKTARASETEEQRAERQSIDSKSHQAARASETDVQTKKRKTDDNKNHRQKRLSEKDRKAEVHKGYVIDEGADLISPSGRKERNKGAGDLKYIDKNGQSYLGEMDRVCEFCQGRGWEPEFKTKAKCEDGEKIKNFGSLCCCKGKVQGIVDYEIPPQLEELYTGQTYEAKLFQVGAVA